MNAGEIVSRCATAAEEFDHREHRSDGLQVIESLCGGLTLIRDAVYARIHTDVERNVGMDSMFSPLSEEKSEQVTKQEIEVFASRCERYPENLTWKFELAMRLKVAGNHAEAIRNFQETMKDTRRRGAVALELGECFQKIKQYQLAMQNYVTAVETLTDREPDFRKRALYRAGVLASGLEDLDSAKKYLSALAGRR